MSALLTPDGAARGARLTGPRFGGGVSVDDGSEMRSEVELEL